MGLDSEAVILGFLVLGIILGVIITRKYVRKQLSFEEWYLEVEKILLKNEYSLKHTQGLNKRMWQEFYYEDYTPKEAVAVYFKQ